METTPDTFPSLFLGYSVIWGLIVIFCIRLGLKQRALERRLVELEEQKDKG
jgi:CcmD family protein